MCNCNNCICCSFFDHFSEWLLLLLWAISIILLVIGLFVKGKNVDFIRIAAILVLLGLGVLAQNTTCYFFLIALIAVLFTNEDFVLKLVAMFTRTKEFWEHTQASETDKRIESQEDVHSFNEHSASNSGAVEPKSRVRMTWEKYSSIEKEVLDKEEHSIGGRIERNQIFRPMRLGYAGRQIQCDGFYQSINSFVLYEVKITHSPNIIERTLRSLAEFAVQYRKSVNKSGVIVLLIAQPTLQGYAKKFDELRRRLEEEYAVQIQIRDVVANFDKLV